MNLSQADIERFWSRVEIGDDDDCWVNTFNPSDEYGRMNIQNKMEAAHRIAWTIINGEIPVGYDLHHRATCSKRCCNPSHLSLVTHVEHSALTNALGQVNIYGENNGSARLTDEQVQQIKRLQSQGVSCRKVAAVFGVSNQYVSRLSRGLNRNRPTPRD